MIYINAQTPNGVKTVDEISKLDFNCYEDFENELNTLINNYELKGVQVTPSQFQTKNWRN